MKCPRNGVNSTWLMGKATELTGQHRHYQANTARNRIVLSTIFVSLKVIDDPRLTLRLANLLAALRCLDQLIQITACPSKNRGDLTGPA
jgi:hypothetical protein